MCKAPAWRVLALWAQTGAVHARAFLNRRQAVLRCIHAAIYSHLRRRALLARFAEALRLVLGWRRALATLT
eukprot:scaffold14051_cov42-Phaeocystis_antarctica.AAC.1